MRRYMVILMLMLTLASLAACRERPPADLSDLEPEEYDILLPDTVLFDESDIKIVAKGFMDEGERGGALYIEITNASETDIDVTATGDCTVNGYKIGFIGTTQNGFTPAGETRLYAMRFEDEYLEPLGIEKINALKISLKFSEIKDGSGYSSDLGPSEPVEIQLREGNPDAIPQGETVYDEGGIRILYLDYQEGTNFYNAQFYVENNSGHDIRVSKYAAAEDEYTGWHSDTDYADGSRGIMSVDLSDDNHDMDHDDVEYMMVSVMISDSATDELLGGFDDYVVEFD